MIKSSKHSIKKIKLYILDRGQDWVQFLTEDQIIYMWVKEWGETLSISFANSDYCDLVMEQLGLMRQNSSEDKTWTKENNAFLTNELKQNIAYVDFLFNTNQKLAQFCDLFKQCQVEKDEILQNFFPILKTVFLRAQPSILQMLMETSFYNTVLQILSLNPFIEKRFNYCEKYKEMTKIHNHLEIADQQILEAYNCNIRVKFIKDCAICMFTEPLTDLMLNNIVAANNIKILQKFMNDPQNLLNLAELGAKSHEAYLATFTEFVEIFKSLSQDFQNKTLKQNFYKVLIDSQFHLLSIAAAEKLTGKQTSGRVFQKWLQTMNYLICYKWEEAQDWILKATFRKNRLSVYLSLWELTNGEHKLFQKEIKEGNLPSIHLMKTLLAIIRQDDFSIKHSVLDFVKGLLEPNELRKVSSRVKWYIHQHFVSKCFQYCNTKPYIQMYIEFIIKLYEFDPVRTRKALIQADSMPQISQQFKDKYVFISALRLLKVIVQKENSDIYRYLSHKKIFQGVKDQYIKCSLSHNVVNSTFLSVFKSLQKCKGQQTKRYIGEIFFPQDAINQVGQFTQSTQMLIEEANNRNADGVVVEPILQIESRNLIQSDGSQQNIPSKSMIHPCNQ